MDKPKTGLPLDFHEDGTPIFQSKNLISEPRPLPPKNDKSSVIYRDVMLPELRNAIPEVQYNLIIIKSSEDIVNQAWLGRTNTDDEDLRFGRILQALDNCRIILQRWSEPGKLTDFIIFSMRPLYYVIVPPTYETLILNTSKNSFARVFELQARGEVRDTSILEKLEGPGYTVDIEGNIQSNVNYDELPLPKVKPGLSEFRFLGNQPLYQILSENPNLFDFMNPPQKTFFIGSF